jgi:2-hydroxychromene-2-carboxylate isomerase
MARALEFFFDYGSPYSYLANHRLTEIAARHELEIRFRPMLLGGVFKATGNQSPMMEPIEAKRAYTGLALRRSAEIYGVPFRTNPHFPINTLLLMRTAAAAQLAGVFERLHRVVYPAFWAEGLDLGDAAVLQKLLDENELDGASLVAGAGEDAAKAALRANTDEAVTRGAFGAPTVFFDKEMYFGADHLFFLERILQGS